MEITYRFFEPAHFERLMFWKAGSGSINYNHLSKTTDKNNPTGEILPKGVALVVMDTDFMMVEIEPS
jgi:hypothetical protein